MSEATEAGAAATILIVDDAPPNLQFLTNLLKKNGYVVHPASEGELALESIQAAPPDLIMLDIRMPGMDGYEVCRRLKEDERTRAIPVIFISILEDEDDKVKGLLAGAVDYITKPFQPEEILARIQTHLRLKELTERLEQKVAERTEKLESANRALATEVAERKRAEETVRLFSAQQKALLEAYQNMSVARMTDIIAFVVEKCVSLTGSSIGFVGLVSDDAAKMTAQVWSDTVMMDCPIEKPLEFPIDDAGLWAEPIRQRTTVIVNDFSAPNPFKKGYPEGHLALTCFMGIPVLDDGKVVAVAGVANKEGAYAESDHLKATLLLNGMWDIIKRKQAEEALQQLNANLERMVQERTAEFEAKNSELERANRLFVGREMRMVELKARIKELEAAQPQVKNALS